MTHPPLPDSCAVAFKEWAGVCDALADGRQSLILRKGGIAEGPRGFVPEHSTFWLYPTRVHEAEQGLRVDRPTAAEGPASIPLPADSVSLRPGRGRDDRPRRPARGVAGLEDLHVWTEETISRRFAYRKPGLWVLGVRIFRSPRPATIAMTPEHAGCKTWVTLDAPLSTAGLVPVIDDAELARRLDRIRSALAAPR
ncbi:MAG: DUF1802 family protein [Singulisphaera sp.]